MKTTNNTTWFRYREKYSSGLSKWKFDRLPCWCKKTKEEVETLLDDTGKLNNWSEHYRGIEVVFVKSIPKDVLEDEIKTAKSNAKYWSEQVKELSKMTTSKYDINKIEKRSKARKNLKLYKELGKPVPTCLEDEWIRESKMGVE
jgi:hypothetical protein